MANGLFKPEFFVNLLEVVNNRYNTVYVLRSNGLMHLAEKHVKKKCDDFNKLSGLNGWTTRESYLRIDKISEESITNRCREWMRDPMKFYDLFDEADKKRRDQYIEDARPDTSIASMEQSLEAARKALMGEDEPKEPVAPKEPTLVETYGVDAVRGAIKELFDSKLHHSSGEKKLLEVIAGLDEGQKSELAAKLSNTN